MNTQNTLLKEFKPNPSETTGESKNTSENFRVVKIYEATSDAIENLIVRANGGGPKRVQVRDIVEFAISKVSESDLKKIREKKLTASDRFEEMFQTYKTDHPAGSRESFYEELMKKISSKDLESQTQSVSRGI